VHVVATDLQELLLELLNNREVVLLLLP